MKWLKAVGQSAVLVERALHFDFQRTSMVAPQQVQRVHAFETLAGIGRKYYFVAGQKKTVQTEECRTT